MDRIDAVARRVEDATPSHASTNDREELLCQIGTRFVMRAPQDYASTTFSSIGIVAARRRRSQPSSIVRAVASEMNVVGQRTTFKAITPDLIVEQLAIPALQWVPAL